MKMKLAVAVLCLMMAGLTFAGNCHPPNCYYRIPPQSNKLCFTRYGHQKPVGYYRYPFNPHLFFYCNKYGMNSGTQQCPTGLWFSEKCVQCLKPYDAVNNVCSKSNNGNGKPSKSADCAPKGFCKHRADGLYGLPSDLTRFFSCVQWRATECQSCPAGLKFSEKCQVCLEHKGAHAPDCPTKGDNSPAAKPPRCASDELCQWKSAGYYAVIDEPNLFYYCNEYEQNVGCQKCPGNLVYNKPCEQCLPEGQYKCDVPVKPDGEIETNFCAPKDFCKQHAIKHKPLTHLFAVEGDSSAFFSCNQLKEATQCLSCPAGLVFNEVCQGCRRYKTDNFESCSPKREEKKDEEEGKPKEEKKEDLEKFRCPDFFCHKRSYGNHELDAASETFISCAPGNQCIKRWCPAGLVYSKACDACTYTYITDKEECQPKAKPNQVIPCRDVNFCKWRKDGIYACPLSTYEPQNVFYQCFRETCYRQACPVNLIFNRQASVCDYKPNPDTQCKVKGFCKGRPNTAYPPPAHLESAEVFYDCYTDPVQVQCVRKTCPGEQVYNASNNQCVIPDVYGNYAW